MSEQINVWCVFSTVAIDEYKTYRSAMRDGTEYTGPMTEQIYRILNSVNDGDLVTGLFKSVDYNSKTYKLFSLYHDGGIDGVANAISLLADGWPNHFIVICAWWVSSGLQVGTEYDEEGMIVGTPIYPIPNNAWVFMPDQVVGEETIVATSNADLMDVNLLAGQAPRIFI